MQRANFFHRLLGLLAAALLAVCCLPMTALAADSSTVTFNIEYLDEGRVVGTQEGVTAETDKDDLVDMTKLDYKLPSGFEMGINSDKFFIEDGDTIAVHIKHIHVNFSLQYRDEDNRILGTQKNISAPIDAEGKVDLASLSLTLPEGCTLAQAPGKLAVKNGDTVVLGVKAPPVPQTVTVNYWDVENKTAAGTGRITVDKGTALEIPVHMLPADPGPAPAPSPLPPLPPPPSRLPRPSPRPSLPLPARMPRTPRLPRPPAMRWSRPTLRPPTLPRSFPRPAFP